MLQTVKRQNAMVAKPFVEVFQFVSLFLEPKKQLTFLNMVNNIFQEKKGFTNLFLVGFARNTYWEYLGVVSNDGEVTARLGLKETQISSEARKAWPHSFNLIYTVTLTDKTIKTFLSLKNEDKEAFEFNTLLHTYFRVPVSDSSYIVFSILNTRLFRKLQILKYKDLFPANTSIRFKEVMITWKRTRR